MEERKLYFDEQWVAFLEELHDVSERACATVGAAFCDDLLGRVFTAYFKGNNPECYGLLLNPENRSAPLGSSFRQLAVGGSRWKFTQFVQFFRYRWFPDDRWDSTLRTPWRHSLPLSRRSLPLSRRPLPIY